MPSYLLLLSESSGVAVGVGAVSVALGPAELELSRLTVGRVSVNDELGGVLALSAKQGGTAALRLLFREFGRNFPIARLDIRTEALSATVTGRSSELLFGLEMFLNPACQDRLIGLQGPAFAATGTLDAEGNVGSVEGVPAKISAAIDSDLSAGSLVFYPRANDDEVTPDLRQRCVARGLVLKPVDQLEEALIALGVVINGRWVGTPYRSLEAFERQHSRIFFGRQDEIRQLVQQLETRAGAGRPGALVIGGSGSGKSSFCMAGVLPALERLSPSLEHAVWRPRDAIPASRGETIPEADMARSVLANWRVRDTKNGAGFSLAASLPDAGSLAELAIALPEDALASRRHVWIIDQFEELFTLGFSPEAKIALARFLSYLQARGVWVIATLRNEFFNRYQDLHDGNIAVLAEVFGTNGGEFKLARMGRDALRQVIVLPAELAGLKFETRASDNTKLDDVILAHAMAIADVLPLLEFTLQLLYDGLSRSDPQEDAPTEQPRLLTFAAYEAIGGIEGAISKIVEPTFAALDAETKKALPGLLDALAVPAADGQRETARPAAIKQWPPGSPERNLIDALVGIRVLVSDDAGHHGVGAQVRVAHEALFTHWPEAAAILEGSRQTRLIIEDFRQRAEAWEKEGCPNSRLLATPKDIEHARILLGKSINGIKHPKIKTFIVESIKAEAEESKRRARQRKLFSLALVLAAVVLAGVAWWALRQRSEAFEQRSSAVAQMAEQAIGRGDAMDGILLALTQLQGDDDSVWSLDPQVALLHGLQSNHEVAALIGHTGEVSDAAFSPDGQRIVTASSDKTARVWTFEGDHWTPIELLGHTDGVTSAAFSPNGQKIVTASSDETARVWTRTGNRWVSIKLSGQFDPLTSAVFSRDGDQIITAANGWDPLVWTFEGDHWTSFGLRGHTNWVTSAAFSPDSQRIVTASADKTARVWTRTGNRWVSIKLSGHTGNVYSAIFGPDSQRIVTASADTTARVWTLTGGRWTAVKLSGHTGAVTSATFSPDGQQVVTASDDNTARVWTFAANRWASVELSGHTRSVRSVAFSPDGQRIATASDDGTIRVWTHSKDGWKWVELFHHNGPVEKAAFSPDGQKIVTASDDKTARVWTLAANRWPSVELRGHTGPVLSAAFSSNDQQIVTASDDNTARVWVMASERWLSLELRGHTRPVRSATFSPDGQQIITASLDNTARLWQLSSQRWKSIELRGHTGPLFSAAFSPSGQQIVTASADNTARIWTLAGDHWTSVKLDGHFHWVSSAAFSPDGQRIVTSSLDRTARVWTHEGNGWTSVELNGHIGPLYSAAFSPDGQSVVTASGDNTARVWKLVADRWTSVELNGHTGPVYSAAFGPDGQRIVTASADNTARVWVFSGKRWVSAIELNAHSGPLFRAAFSPDGRQIVTASTDGSARLWPVTFGKELRDQALRSRTRCLTNLQLSFVGLPSQDSDPNSNVLRSC